MIRPWLDTLIGVALLFFCFEHKKAPVAALTPALMEMGQHQSHGNFVHLKPRGEDRHYFGHTDPAMMKVISDVLKRGGIPFIEMEESELPADKQRTIAAIRVAGQLD